MNVYSDLSDLKTFRNAVVTIGSFDGVHAGHRRILQQVRALAGQVGGESVVVTFHPHPRLLLKPKDTSLQLLNTISEKVSLLEEEGIENVVVVPFTREFASQTPQEYITNFLVGKFQPRYVVIGYDHQFGKGRKGNVGLLRTFEQEAGFEIVEIARHDIDDITVSSTKIRTALLEGDIRKANGYLQYRYPIHGVVVHGQGLGRNLGFPTANLEVRHAHKLIPGDGIYAVWVRYRERWFEGMMYIGTRPTIKRATERVIEVHLFGFEGDLYGDRLTVELVEKLRGDEPFPGLEALSKQLEKDAARSREVLNKETDRPDDTPPPAPESFPSSAIVILNYNGKEYLKTFLPILQQTTYPNFRIVVADNLSTDDSVAYLLAHHPDVEVIQLHENYGFAGGYNLALQQVEADYVVLLNSDVEVTPGWLEPMIALFESDERIAAVQPKVLTWSDKGRFEYAGASGGWIDSLGYPFCRGRIFSHTEEDRGQYDDTGECFWATGAAMVIRPRLFRDIGGFDADYFAHLEEIDLCWRLKRAGYRVMVCPESVVYHVGGGTLDYLNPRKTYLNFRNSLYTIYKNTRSAKRRWLIPFRLVLDGLAAGLFLVEGKFAHIRSILFAHFHFYRDLRDLRRKTRRYNDLIEKVSISPEMNREGLYSGSVVFDFYVRGRRVFSRLSAHKSSV